MLIKIWSMVCGFLFDKIMSSGGKVLFDVNFYCVCWVLNIKFIVDFKCVELFIFFLMLNVLNIK